MKKIRKFKSKLNKNPWLGWTPLFFIPLVLVIAHSGTWKNGRRLASIQSNVLMQPVTAEVRLYGKKNAEYLPKWTPVFARAESFHAKLTLKTDRPLNTNESISCNWFTDRIKPHELEKAKVAGSFKLDPSGFIDLSIQPEIASVYCHLESDDYGINLSLSLNQLVVPESMDILLLRQKIDEQQKLISRYVDTSKLLQLLEKDPNQYQAVIQKLNQIPALQNHWKEGSFSFDVNQGLVKVFEIFRGDWYRIENPGGQAKPNKLGLKWRGPQGTDNPLVIMNRSETVWPEAKYYSMVCGFESQNSQKLGRLLFSGSQGVIYGRVSNPGLIKCAFNTVPKKWDHALGRFSFQYKQVKKGLALEWLSKEVNDLKALIISQNTEIAAIQNQNNQNAYNNLLPVFQQIREHDLKIREMEPAILCKRTESITPAFDFREISRLKLPSGEFCTLPVTQDQTTFLTSCDGTKGTDLHNGKIIKFDLSMKSLSSDKVISRNSDTPWYSIDRFSQAQVRTDSITGKSLDYVVPTSDGRVIFLSLDGKRIGEITFDQPLITGLSVHADGRVFGIAVGDGLVQDKPSILFSIGLDQKLIWKKEVPFEISGNPILGLALDAIVMTNDQGSILVFDLDGNQKNQLQFEAGSRSSPLALFAQAAYFGTSKGSVFRFDLKTSNLSKLYQARYSGQTDYLGSSGRNQLKPIAREITLRPIVGTDGSVIVATTYDGRIHFLNPDGSLIKMTQVHIVGRLTEFGTIRWPSMGEPLLFANTISYMNVMKMDGSLIGKYDQGAGGEHFNLPLPISGSGLKYQDQFLLADFHGVGRYEMKLNLKKTADTVYLESCVSP